MLSSSNITHASVFSLIGAPSSGSCLNELGDRLDLPVYLFIEVPVDPERLGDARGPHGEPAANVLTEDPAEGIVGGW